MQIHTLILYLTQFHPIQETEQHNSNSEDAWMNKLFEEQTKW